MRRLFSLLIIGALAYFSWPYLTENKEVIKNEIENLKENPELASALEKLNSGINQLIWQVNEKKEELTQDEKILPKVSKPELETPSEKTFTIHNIGIGDGKGDVEKQLGAPKRVSVNEYGTEWHAYHENFQNFIMVSYSKDGTVNALFTNQELIAAKNGIKYGASKETVRQTLGEPLGEIRKGLVYYQFQKDQDYDVYNIDDSYVTVFYDKHRNNTVTAIQIISEKLEQSKAGFYTEASDALKEGFEYQLFDLTNASRVVHGLGILTWDDPVRVTARRHSADMAENSYFSHTNPEGQSPFDRMAEDDIAFSVAGENLAYGQFSSIFAHEGLMNSLGHRENILKPDFKLLGVGVAFGPKHEPYFTENFYSKRKF
ncbi:CAP domain-containing protein [Bacillus sp. ISL-35]|uniref:CAP domain-containing protein n=1 Tax=Bacillus sp. ISL-35 TaxID=2819122 RepID=UPI001BECFC65|nr:CAP domain-containing protein [Bacillus sp. ISL-35]MBT2679948.1 CAP domain-containing protein [Bacillus sp. ISL-35]MBT2703077.1 CAP domain-containing protein [Chryseobacterium sp. ISL-80]